MGSQTIQNGKIFLQNRRTIIIGISPGNPYFYKLENLQKFLKFGRNNSDEVLLFLPDKISEHNYKAIGSKNPEKSARVNAKRLRNKCKEAIQETELQGHILNYINWMEEVESSPEYEEALNGINNLYQRNDEFCADISDSTEAVLKCLKNGRERDGDKQSDADEVVLDLEEGVKYPLKELAFLTAIPRIYDRCEEFVLVYYRPWPVLEKFFDGGYDGTLRPYLGFVVLD